MITETYKKMCIKNPDLQGLWKPLIGHRYWRADDGLVSIVHALDILVPHELTNNNMLYWLPYQEDLQELLDFKNWANRGIEVICRLGLPLEVNFEMGEDKYYTFDVDSLEESFLGLLMDYKFNKQWNFEKKEWVKI